MADSIDNPGIPQSEVARLLSESVLSITKEYARQPKDEYETVPF